MACGDVLYWYLFPPPRPFCLIWMLVQWNLLHGCSCIVSSWNPVFQPSLSKRASPLCPFQGPVVPSNPSWSASGKWQSTSLGIGCYVGWRGGGLFMMRGFYIIVFPCLIALSLQVYIFTLTAFSILFHSTLTWTLCPVLDTWIHGDAIVGPLRIFKSFKLSGVAQTKYSKM